MPAEGDLKRYPRKRLRSRRPGACALCVCLLLVLTVLLFGAGASTQALTGDFSDVPAGHPYAAAIDDLQSRGVIGGYFDGERRLFKPDNPVLRAQFAKMICGALAIPVTEGQAGAVHRSRPERSRRSVSERLRRSCRRPRDHDRHGAGSLLAVEPHHPRPTRHHGGAGRRSTGAGRAVRATWHLRGHACHRSIPITTSLCAPPNGTAFSPVSSVSAAAWNPWADASRGETAQILFNLMGVAGASDAEPRWWRLGDARDGGSGDGSVDSPLQPLGANVAITFRLFPADNPWNTDISKYPVHPLSARYIASIGRDTGIHPDFGTVWNGAPNGIPYVVVSGNQPRVPMSFYYADESDPGPYPIPADAPIEGGPTSDGDRHVLVLDATHRLLYEVYDAHFCGRPLGSRLGRGVRSDQQRLRPDTWTSADAAGLPILPGLVRYDEVASGEITHALRFTVSRTQRAYIHPATHFASDEHRPRPAAHGPSPAPEGGLRHLRFPGKSAGDPPRAQEVRDDRRRQRRRLVHLRRTRPPLGRRGAAHVRARCPAAPSKRWIPAPSSPRGAHHDG